MVYNQEVEAYNSLNVNYYSQSGTTRNFGSASVQHTQVTLANFIYRRNLELLFIRTKRLPYVT